MMELLSDVGHIKSCFGQFGDSVSIGARWGHGLRQTYPRLGNHLGQSQWNSKAMWLLWSLVSVHSVTVSVSEQDWCTVCTKRTIGSEIILDAPDSTRR
jgi:hypothetical protein